MSTNNAIRTRIRAAEPAELLRLRQLYAGDAEVVKLIDKENQRRTIQALIK